MSDATKQTVSVLKALIAAFEAKKELSEQEQNDLQLLHKDVIKLQLKDIAIDAGKNKGSNESGSEEYKEVLWLVYFILNEGESAALHKTLVQAYPKLYYLVKEQS
jgi:hypothetical protein